MNWPKGPTYWRVNKTLNVSIPFTWNLYTVKRETGFFDKVVVGGPAVKLIPDYFNDCKNITVGEEYDGVLQLVNPLATKTTVGCVRKCGFCAVPKIEGKFKELNTYPNRPIICDNNILASSIKHFDAVIDKLLQRWGWADFNQGLDCRLLTSHHAKRIAEIKKPMIRLALDSMSDKELWERAFNILRRAGIALNKIRSYALIAFNSDPGEAWERCGWIEKHKIKALPMWFHELNADRANYVTKKQQKLGWTDQKRKEIMRFHYFHSHDSKQGFKQRGRQVGNNHEKQVPCQKDETRGDNFRLPKRGPVL